MKKNTATPFAIALGTSLISGLSVNTAQANTIDADNNPFAMTELSSGYLQTAQSDDSKGMEGKCGEGKCGSSMMQSDEEKTVEGKCAGSKPMPEDKSKDMEGKCGEGKCGASMQ